MLLLYQGQLSLVWVTVLIEEGEGACCVPGSVWMNADVTETGERCSSIVA